MVVVYFMCIIFIYECITSRSSSWLVRTYSEVSKNTSRTYSIDSGEQELPIATHIQYGPSIISLGVQTWIDFLNIP